MKTTWTADSIYRSMGTRAGNEWANAQRQEFEKSTGVKWNFFTAAGKFVFQPVLRVTQVAPDDSPEKAARLLSAVTHENQTWLSLSEVAGMSLPETMAVGAALIKAGQVTPDVNRAGGLAYVRKAGEAKAAQAWLQKDRLDPADRVWQGQRALGRAPSSRQQREAQGEVGERLAAQALSETQGGTFVNQNQPGKKPAPVDLVGGGLGVEVKTGMATRAVGEWRTTTGTISQKDKALLAAFTPEERTEYWTRKRAMAIQRKNRLLKKLSAEVGHELKGVTVGVILSADGERADLFLIDGLHNSLAWKAHATNETYLGTLSTGKGGAQEAARGILGA